MECEQLQEQERRKKKKDIVGCKTILLLLFKQDRCDRESGEIAQLCQCCKMTGLVMGNQNQLLGDFHCSTEKWSHEKCRGSEREQAERTDSKLPASL